MTGGEIFGAIFVFFVICAVLEWLLKKLAAIAEYAVANFVSTILVVGGVVMGIALLAGNEASAAVAIAVPAATTVAKMRLTTGF